MANVSIDPDLEPECIHLVHTAVFHKIRPELHHEQAHQRTGCRRNSLGHGRRFSLPCNVRHQIDVTGNVLLQHNLRGIEHVDRYGGAVIAREVVSLGFQHIEQFRGLVGQAGILHHLPIDCSDMIAAFLLGIPVAGFEQPVRVEQQKCVSIIRENRLILGRVWTFGPEGKSQRGTTPLIEQGGILDHAVPDHDRIGVATVHATPLQLFGIVHGHEHGREIGRIIDPSPNHHIEGIADRRGTLIHIAVDHFAGRRL